MRQGKHPGKSRAWYREHGLVEISGVRVDAALLVELDAVAADEGLSRGALVEMWIRDALARRQIAAV